MEPGEWLSVLKVSSQWHFKELRKEAIRKLDRHTKEAVELIKLGKAYYISSWLIRGWKGLVRHSEAITVEEAEAIGWQAALKLCGLRERRLKSDDAVLSDLTSALHSTFEDDLAKIQEAEAKYGPPVAANTQPEPSINCSENSVDTTSSAISVASAIGWPRGPPSQVKTTPARTSFGSQVSWHSLFVCFPVMRSAYYHECIRCLLVRLEALVLRQPNHSLKAFSGNPNRPSQLEHMNRVSAPIQGQWRPQLPQTDGRRCRQRRKRSRSHHLDH